MVNISAWVILDALPTAVVLVDSSFIIRYQNAAWQQLAHRTTAANGCVVGASFLSTYPAAFQLKPHDWQQLQDAMTSVGQQERTQITLRFQATVWHKPHHFEAICVAYDVAAQPGVLLQQRSIALTERLTVEPRTFQAARVSDVCDVSESVTTERLPVVSADGPTTASADASSPVIAEFQRILHSVQSDTQVISERLARYVVDTLGDLCVIRLRTDGDAQLTTTAIYHQNSWARKMMQQIIDRTTHRTTRDIPNYVLRTGEVVHLSGAALEAMPNASRTAYRSYLKRFGIAALVSVPMRAEGQVQGVLVLSRDQNGAPYDHNERALLQDLADLTMRALVAVRTGHMPAPEEPPAQAHRPANQGAPVPIQTNGKPDHLSWERIAACSPALLYVYDLAEQAPICTNHIIADLLGYQADSASAQLINNFPISALHPDDMPRLRQHFERCAEANDDDKLELEYRIQHANGSWYWILCQERILSRHPDGAVHEMTGLALDITQHKEAQAQRRLSEQHYRQIIERMHEGVFSQNECGLITYVNPRFGELLGYTRAALIGQPLKQLVDQTMHAYVAAHMAQQQAGTHETYILPLRTNAGKPLVVLVSMTPLFDSEGQFRGSFAICSQLANV